MSEYSIKTINENKGYGGFIPHLSPNMTYLLRNLSWRLTEKPENAKIPREGKSYDEWDEADLDEIVWPSGMTIYVGVDRYSDMKRSVEIAQNEQNEQKTYVAYATYVTLGGFLQQLYNFFNEEELNEDDIEELKNFVEDGDDMFDYKRNAIENYENGQPVFWTDIMGDAIFFEGLMCIGQNQFRLLTGS